MNAPRFNDFLAQTSQNLDPDEEVIFKYTLHQYIEIPPSPRLTPSPFMNIVEQKISSLKAAIKGDVLRPKYRLEWTTEQKPEA